MSPPVSGSLSQPVGLLGLQEGAQALVEVDLGAADQADPLQPAAGHVQLGGGQVLQVRPDPVEAVDVGGGQDLPAEALAPGRGGVVEVGPQQQGEQAGRGLGVGVAPADRGLDGGRAGEPALQGRPAITSG